MKCTNKISVFSLSIILWLTIVYNLYAQGQQISFPKYDPHQNAEQQLKIAIQKAQQENKRILVDVGGEWCIWCHRLDSLFINTPELLRILNEHYVLIKINVSKENKNEIMFQNYLEHNFWLAYIRLTLGARACFFISKQSYRDTSEMTKWSDQTFCNRHHQEARVLN